jgi:hypothetical protein
MRRALIVTVLVFLALSSSAADAPQKVWRFAVAGDSRNCGDVVMPAIAAAVKRDDAAFYWHLGDLRALYDYDEDMAAEAKKNEAPLDVQSYLRRVWPDAVRNQLMPFAPVPFYLTIGNHELVPPKTRPEFIVQFADWLNQRTIAEQRLADDPADHLVRTYYHWIVQGTDFISVDNASGEMFDDAQVSWIEKVLASDHDNAAVHSVVIGMHAALPHSLACDHSMSDLPQPNESGTRVYRDLLRFRSETGKQAYVLASHSHFVVSNAFDSDYWRANGGVLPGWIIGTAGAVRYRLPETAKTASLAKTDIYGYVLATVRADGTIDFAFHEITKADVPAAVVTRYSQALVDQCFDANRSMRAAKPVTCADAVAPCAPQ